jgi:secretion/DNA translocation related TadE-like protein
VTRPRSKGRAQAHWRDDAGFVTTFAIGVIPLLLLLGGVVASATAVAATRHRAEGAADLAALAAAHHALEGDRAACAAAEHVAQANGADVLSCRLEGADAVVEVASRLPGRLSPLGQVHGKARAGRR